jgi:DegV family protein with EDD domain
MKIAYITDSGTGRSIDDLARDGIYSLPLQITDNTTTYQDMETLSKAECISLLQQKHILSTSQPAVGLVLELFESLKKQGVDLAVAIPICNGLSGTISTMTAAAEETGLQLITFDTYTTAVVQDYLIHRCKKAKEDGMDGAEITLLLQKVIASCETIVIPADMMHLARSGRVTPSAARLGALLRIRPILHLNRETGGKIDALDKVISMRRALKRVIEHMQEKPMGSSWHITIAHVAAIDTAQQFYHEIHQTFPEAEVEIIELCNPVSVYVGIGAICLQYFEKF